MRGLGDFGDAMWSDPHDKGYENAKRHDAKKRSKANNHATFRFQK